MTRFWKQTQIREPFWAQIKSPTILRFRENSQLAQSQPI